jgi:hypothetical protein
MQGHMMFGVQVFVDLTEVVAGTGKLVTQMGNLPYPCLHKRVSFSIGPMHLSILDHILLQDWRVIPINFVMLYSKDPEKILQHEVHTVRVLRSTDVPSKAFYEDTAFSSGDDATKRADSLLVQRLGIKCHNCSSQKEKPTWVNEKATKVLPGSDYIFCQFKDFVSDLFRRNGIEVSSHADNFALQPYRYPWCATALLAYALLKLTPAQWVLVCATFARHHPEYVECKVECDEEDRSAQTLFLQLFEPYLYHHFHQYFLDGVVYSKENHIGDWKAIETYAVCMHCNQCDTPAEIFQCNIDSCHLAVHKFCKGFDIGYDNYDDEWYCDKHSTH